MVRPDKELNPAMAAYQEIKRRIVEVEYVLGEKLSEARLIEELGFGRSPIRTALARLNNEGWISVSPQSGTFVRALTNRDIEQVTELRTLLEMHATREAARKITDPELERIQRSFRALGPLIEAGDVEAFINLDKDLHNTIYVAADNEMIADILLDLRDKVQWIRRACSVSLERMIDGFHELETIIDALGARDSGAAAEAMRAHIVNAAAFCRTVDMEEVREALAARKTPRGAKGEDGHSNGARAAAERSIN